MAVSLFHEQWYLDHNPDVVAAVAAGQGSAYQHFLLHGQYENRAPATLFDPVYYLARNPDVAAAVAAGQGSAYEHFLLHGQSEPRAITPFLDLGAYRAANPDLAAIEGLNLYQHLVTYGLHEDRDLGNGITLAQFANDPVFNAALADPARILDALARVAEVAPFLPSFRPPAGWTPAPGTPIPLDFVPLPGQLLVVPPTVVVPEGVVLPDTFIKPIDEGGGGEPSVSFTVTETGDVPHVEISFDNAGASISVVETGGKLVFTSGSTSVTTAADATSIASIQVPPGTALSGPTSVFDGKAISGDYGISDTWANIQPKLCDDVITDAATVTVTGLVPPLTVAEFTALPTNVTLDGGYSISDTWAAIKPKLASAMVAYAEAVNVTNLAALDIAGFTALPPHVTLDGGYNITDTIAAANSLNFNDAVWTGIKGVTLTGSSGNQTVTGSAFDDYIDGGDDTDTLSGGDGNDSLRGGAGDDTLNGDDGKDMLLGGAGDDTLTGGNGADTFIFIRGTNASASAVAADNGTDTITDFKSSDGDILDVSDLLTGVGTFIKGNYSTLSEAVGNYNVIVLTNTQNESGGPLGATHVDALARSVSSHAGSGILVFNNNGTVQIWYDAAMAQDNSGSDVALIGVIGTPGAAADLANLTSYNFT